MVTVHLLAIGHIWLAAVSVVVLMAGVIYYRYGRMLERQTQERSERQSI